MLRDILIASPAFAAAIGLLWTSARSPEDRTPAVLTGLVALLAITALWSFAFDGYRSDLWVYLTVSERIAAGDWLIGHEPFRLEPPGSPHHSLLWIAAGLFRRFTGVPAVLMFRVLGVLTITTLAIAAWRLASKVFEDRRSRWLATALFLGSLSELWATIELNRNVALVFVLLALSEVFSTSEKRFVRLAAWIALAFWVHFFGGLLTLAAGSAALAVPAQRKPALGALAAGLTFASPAILYHLSLAGNPVNPDYLWGPGQYRWSGLRWLNPLQLLREIPPGLLALGAAGLIMSGPRMLLPETVRRYLLLATAAVSIVLLTPLYHLWCEYLGGWLALRLVPMLLLWIPAANLLAWTFSTERLFPKVAAVLLTASVFWQGAARVVRDGSHGALHYRFTAEAQSEAAALKDVLSGGLFLAPDDLAYGITGKSLARPFTVTPGRASPYHPFRERSADALAALRTNSESCWRAFLARYPEVTYLVTPAAGGQYENLIWKDSVPRIRPSTVRQTLAWAGLVETVHLGNHYVVDRFKDPERLTPTGTFPDTCTITEETR